MARIPIDVEEEMNAPQPPPPAEQLSPLAALKKRKQELLDEGNSRAALAIEFRIRELEGSSQNNLTEPAKPLEQVTAEPMTPEEESGYDGVTIQEPAPKPTEQSSKLDTTAGLQTKAPIVSAPEIDSDKLEMPMEETPEPKIDETEQLMGEYRKAREQYQSDVDTLEQDREASEASRQRMTGIAGALSSFGEGLAAITGGSAKPLQAGVAAVKGMGEQQAAAEERKAKTLKERLQMAKAPLEEKQTEIDLRSRLSKGKMEQDLMDPASQQSAQARKDAGAFIDNMIAQGTANRASPDVLQRLEQTKSLIGQMSAAQVQQFYNTLKPLSTETSVEAKNKFDMDKLAAQESLKMKLADAKSSKDEQKIAQKEFIKDQSAIAKQVAETSAVSQEMKSFRNDLKLALAGDREAAKRVTQKGGVINYLNARSVESKGVFTDNDLRALSELQATKWFDQFNDWVSKGFEGVLPKASLVRIQDILDRNAYKFDNPEKYVYGSLIEKYKGLDEVSETGVWKPYLSNLEKKAVPAKIEQVEPQAAQEGLVDMTAPDGRKLKVPANKVQELEARGAKRS